MKEDLLIKSEEFLCDECGAEWILAPIDEEMELDIVKHCPFCGAEVQDERQYADEADILDDNDDDDFDEDY